MYIEFNELELVLFEVETLQRVRKLEQIKKDKKNESLTTDWDNMVPSKNRKEKKRSTKRNRTDSTRTPEAIYTTDF